MVERPADDLTGPVRVRRAVEEEADEGLLLAEYATRMRLKNRIIVDTVTAQGSVDPEAWADEVRLALGGLRVEAEASARRMEQEEPVARLTRGSAVHEHDYRASDADNLERRRRVYRLVARRLLRWENDPAQIAALLEAARHDAQEEIDAALRRAVSGDPVGRVEDEGRLRERLRLITTVDLPALEAAVRGEAAPIPVPRRRTWWERLLGRA
ncbi:hypothetical protein [Amnibacterium kyonggiense]|uniref:Asparagine synthase n=1 Tax=Amnibacterium kyonggiense TaxID=595671 RepID=A0A4R7FM38_9MICO|nr:hypothetical protein [Amnibacterium kyonggiense]TDS77500.1 hypothetical protein CLV52_2446 [Amnibacterium kyonggiense]